MGIYPREKAMAQTVEISLQIGVSTASVSREGMISADTPWTTPWSSTSARRPGGQPFQPWSCVSIATTRWKTRRPVGACSLIGKLGTMPGVKRVGVIIERSI